MTRQQLDDHMGDEPGTATGIHSDAQNSAAEGGNACNEQTEAAPHVIAAAANQAERDGGDGGAGPDVTMNAVQQ